MKNFQFRHCFGALFLSLFILLPKHCFGQGSGVNVTLSIDTSNKNLPISLALQPNDRSDIVAIRVTLQSGKFVAFMPATDTISILPLSDRSLEIYAGQPDSLSAFEPAPGKTIFRFLTDSSTRDLDLDVELLNKNFQIVFQQRIKIAISIKFYLPGPCSQTFLSLSTGKNQVTGANYAPGTIDPYWSLTSVPLG